MRPFLERLVTDTGLGEWPAYFTQTDSVSLLMRCLADFPESIEVSAIL
jgi:hypothetical protein